MKIEIKPVQKTLTLLNIVGINVSLDNSAIIQVSILGENNVSQSVTLFMSPEVYAGWGSSDDYVVNWVLNELGLQRA